jgi:hypothetical protein
MISVWAEWHHQSGCAPSEASETPGWWSPLCAASIPRVMLQITFRLLFHSVFSLGQSPVLNEHFGIVANCDHTSEWVDWVYACIRIAMRWVTLRKSFLVFLLPLHTMQFSLYKIYKSFQVARSMWLLTIRHSFHLSPVLLPEAISGIMCAQPTMFPMLKNCSETTAGHFLICTNFETDSKFPKSSGIVVSAKAN